MIAPARSLPSDEHAPGRGAMSQGAGSEKRSDAERLVTIDPGARRAGIQYQAGAGDQ
jgi:hypothetical protein